MGRVRVSWIQNCQNCNKFQAVEIFKIMINEATINSDVSINRFSFIMIVLEVEKEQNQRNGIFEKYSRIKASPLGFVSNLTKKYVLAFTISLIVGFI